VRPAYRPLRVEAHIRSSGVCEHRAQVRSLRCGYLGAR
jgi:hypothetical protein